MIITTPELQKLINAKNKDYVLIDVRRHDELHNGMIPTAVHLPLYELEEVFALDEKTFKKKYNFKKPDKKKLIILYCRTGGRSYTATSLLSQKGFRAVNYAGSIWEWSEIDSSVKKYFH